MSELNTVYEGPYQGYMLTDLTEDSMTCYAYIDIPEGVGAEEVAKQIKRLMNDSYWG